MDYLRARMLELKALEREDSLNERALEFCDSINYYQHQILLRTNNSLLLSRANESDLKQGQQDLNKVIANMKEVETKKALKSTKTVAVVFVATFAVGFVAGWLSAH